MIPVITMDKNGTTNYQVFNDNLTTVEQINRILLHTVFYAQQTLVNEDTSVMQDIGKAKYTDEQLTTLKTKAEELDKAVRDAVAAFATAVAAL